MHGRVQPTHRITGAQPARVTWHVNGMSEYPHSMLLDCNNFRQRRLRARQREDRAPYSRSGVGDDRPKLRGLSESFGKTSDHHAV